MKYEIGDICVFLDAVIIKVSSEHLKDNIRGQYHCRGIVLKNITDDPLLEFKVGGIISPSIKDLRKCIELPEYLRSLQLN